MPTRILPKPKRPTVAAAIAFAAVAALSREADAVLSYNVEPNGWPSAAHRDAAVAAVQSSVNRYNVYGNFGNHNIYVYYNSGIPTAQASYLGSIGFGGTYPNERVMMHELAHYVGSGTYGDPWNGTRGEALVDQFDGIEATLQGDANHFWPYGLNYDSEGSEINKQRQVALVYAQRADMGIGSTANPWSATAVNLTASDAFGESGFNYARTWSDNRFAHPGAAYSTGNFLFRTPASGNSFNFVGDSVRINNTNGINGGLLYKGTGTTGVTTFNNLILDGGYVRHANGSGDLFRLGGNVTLASASTIDAAQGPITVSASIGGSGSLTKTGSHPLTLSGVNTYSGSTTVNAGTIVLDQSFTTGSGVTVAGGATLRLTAGGNKTLKTNALLLTGGKLDLGDNDLLIDYPSADPSPEVQLRQWVKSGRIAGSTSGIFVTPGSPDDDKVLAIADNVTWGKSSFNGINIDSFTVVGKYTYFGDANLDGKVTGDDYLNVDANLGTGDSWLEGDFNMSGVTTGDDYLAIDANLGKGTTTPLAFAELKEEMVAAHVAMFGDEYLVKLAAVEANGFGAIPEPTAIRVISAGGFAMLARRRRRS